MGVKVDAKKKPHTSSELSIIKSYLFRGRLADHNPLHERGTELNPSARRESFLYAGIYSIKATPKLAGVLKATG